MNRGPPDYKAKDVLKYLQDNELNVFSQAGKSRQAIQLHLQGKDICENPSQNNLHLRSEKHIIDDITAVVPVPQCIVLDRTQGARALQIVATSKKYDVGTFSVRENDGDFIKFTTAKGHQTFYIPLENGHKIDLCVRKPLTKVDVTYCN